MEDIASTTASNAAAFRTSATPANVSSPNTNIAHAIANIANSVKKIPFIDDPLTLREFLKLNEIPDHDLTHNEHEKLLTILPPHLAKSLRSYYEKSLRIDPQLQKIWIDKIIGSDLETTRCFIEYCGIMKKGIDINDCNQNGVNALTMAAKEGRWDVVQELLNTANIDVRLNEKGFGTTALIFAAASGNTEICKQLLEKGADINRTNGENETALMIASKEGRLSTVKLLLTYGDTALNIQQSKTRATALILATEINHTEIVSRLLEKGANINLTDNKNETALMIASKNGNQNIVALLLESDHIDLNIQRKDSGLFCKNCGYTALIYAAVANHKEIARQLIKNGADINRTNDKNETALMLAARLNHLEVAKQLLNDGAAINLTNNKNETALMIASVNGNQNIVALLLESDHIDLNIQHKHSGNTALIYAVLANNEEIVSRLIKNGAAINLTNNENETALMLASEHGYQNIVTLLLEHYQIDLDIQSKPFGTTALTYAVAKNHVEIVRKLIDRKANVNLSNNNNNNNKDNDNETALMIASKNGNQNIVALLLESDQIDLNIQSRRFGTTALTYAVAENHVEIARKLINRKANVNLTNNDNETALMIASRNGNQNMVTLLLESDHIDLNTQHAHLGNTALIHAVTENHVEVVKKLINRKANVNLTNNKKETALIIALKSDYQEIVDILLTADHIADDIPYNRQENKYIEKTGMGAGSPVEKFDTALTCAVRLNNKKAIKQLLEKGGNVNLAGRDNETPLHIATKLNHLETVRLLLEKNPDDKHFALKLAQNLGHTEVVTLLKETIQDSDVPPGTRRKRPPGKKSMRTHS
jgi:ankyrin repeat protein